MPPAKTLCDILQRMGLLKFTLWCVYKWGCSESLGGDGFMQKHKLSFQIYSNFHRLSFKLKNTRSIQRAIEKQKIKPNFILISTANKQSRSLPSGQSKSSLNSLDETQSQSYHYISLIRDPLWKRVCREFSNIMGPVKMPPIWTIKLGYISHKKSSFDLYCQSKELAQFTKQYAFLLLGILQRYFPALKEIKVVITLPLFLN